MAQWHLAPGSFSWDDAAAALAGDPAAASDGSNAAAPPGLDQPPAVPVA